MVFQISYYTFIFMINRISINLKCNFDSIITVKRRKKITLNLKVFGSELDLSFQIKKFKFSIIAIFCVSQLKSQRILRIKHDD